MENDRGSKTSRKRAKGGFRQADTCLNVLDKESKDSGTEAKKFEYCLPTDSVSHH